MDLLRMTRIGSMAAMAALAACDGRSEATAPTTHASVAGSEGLAAAPALAAGTEAANGGDDAVDTQRPRKRGGGAFGVGIRPSPGASGILP
jgi:hypothetical protein